MNQKDFFFVFFVNGNFDQYNLSHPPWRYFVYFNMWCKLQWHNV